MLAVFAFFSSSALADSGFCDDPDAVETAATIGISRERAVNYHADSKGTSVLFQALSAPMSAMRAGKALECDWKADIEADFEARKEKPKKFGKK